MVNQIIILNGVSEWVNDQASKKDGDEGLEMNLIDIAIAFQMNDPVIWALKRLHKHELSTKLIMLRLHRIKFFLLLKVDEKCIFQMIFHNYHFVFFFHIFRLFFYAISRWRSQT